MPTRSGNSYLKSNLCKCGEFYAYNKFNYKCSQCYKCTIIDPTHTRHIHTLKGYIQKCNNWANETCFAKDHSTLKHLQKISKMKNDIIFYKVSRIILQMSHKFLFAEDALKMYHDNPTVFRAHIVGSMVGDWWNINSKKTTWPPFISCYYGNYDEPLVPCNHTPPRMPNKIQNVFVELPSLE